MYAKRDVAKANESKLAEAQKARNPKNEDNVGELEESSDNETYMPLEDAEDEETTVTDNTSKEMETTITMETGENKEEAQPAEKANPQEMNEIQELHSAAGGSTGEEGPSTKKAVKASVEWSKAKLREPRKRKPTERYGIDVIMSVTGEQSGNEKK